MALAGFEPWDVQVRDLLSGHITLEGFLLKVFVGGFSYADVLESARGWAATILFNKDLKAQFDAFYARRDSFSLASLGICNGCQLMVQLNFVPWKGIEKAKQPRFIQNKCEGACKSIKCEYIRHSLVHSCINGNSCLFSLLIGAFCCLFFTVVFIMTKRLCDT